MAQANTAAAMVELSSIALALTAIMRRHIVNTSVTSDIGAKTSNLIRMLWKNGCGRS